MSHHANADNQPATTIARIAEWPAFAPVHEAAKLSGLSRSAQYREAGAGRIKMVKAGRRTLIDMASLRDFMAALPAARIAPPRAA